MEQRRKRIYKRGYYGKHGKRRKIVKELNRRQNGKCAMCGVNGDNKLEVDHIKKFADGGEHNLDNLQLLCTECHDKKDNQPKGTQRYIYSKDLIPHHEEK